MTMELPEYIDAPIRDKLGKVIATVINNLPEEPQQAVVGVTWGNGVPEYPNAWLFTENYVVEIRNPLNQDRIQHDLALFRGRVDWIRLNARRYEFSESPTENSELDLEFTTTDGFSGTLSTVGKGCVDLMKVYRDRFLQNFTAIER